MSVFNPIHHAARTAAKAIRHDRTMRGDFGA